MFVIIYFTFVQVRIFNTSNIQKHKRTSIASRSRYYNSQNATERTLLLRFASGCWTVLFLCRKNWEFGCFSFPTQSKAIVPKRPYQLIKMTEQMTLRGTLKGHSGWVTQIATTPQFPDMILSASRGERAACPAICALLCWIYRCSLWYKVKHAVKQSLWMNTVKTAGPYWVYTSVFQELNNTVLVLIKI